MAFVQANLFPRENATQFCRIGHPCLHSGIGDLDHCFDDASLQALTALQRIFFRLSVLQARRLNLLSVYDALFLPPRLIHQQDTCRDFASDQFDPTSFECVKFKFESPQSQPTLRFLALKCERPCFSCLLFLSTFRLSNICIAITSDGGPALQTIVCRNPGTMYRPACFVTCGRAVQKGLS